MGDYIKSIVKQVKDLLKVKSTEHDEDLEVIFDKIYTDGFQDGSNDQENQNNKRILLSRKPESLKEVYGKTTGKITPAELSEMMNQEKEIGEQSFKDWNEMQEFNFSEYRLWKVLLKTEDEFILVDTQGYDYPRYVGILERESDTLSPEAKIESYKEYFIVMMNDLSKDELADMLWDLKSYSEKRKEATEYSRTLDW
ncbi:hypothetical protein K9M74_03230 [Candidatus Woesearchaeota archaeon]|nr:hypothetical protein [Candidatus Woesearchaeota archaeon]MCF7859154.1 hypothetical protein [Candidatus Cloacimonadota bacterium]MCF8012825.1 hypothetical protein [Candidatus Woesearchaeota archaeon]